MARAPRTGGMIGRRPPTGPLALANFHNQGVARSDYASGARGGFTVEFLGPKATTDLRDALTQGVVAIRSSSIEAAVSSTDEIKQRMRSFLDAHFTGSRMHANAHRRVSNASVQSVYYDDVADQGQFTSLIYSKFGFRGPGGFVDFLLLHMRGGRITPQGKDWLRIPAAGARTGFGQAGHYPVSDSDIFFARSKDGSKLFQLRRKRGAGPGAKATELIATLVKSVTIAPSLAGLEAIMATRGAVFEKHFDALFERRMQEGY